MDRDRNAAINILNRGIGTTGRRRNFDPRDRKRLGRLDLWVRCAKRS